MPKAMNLDARVRVLRDFYRSEDRVPSYSEMLGLFGYRSKNAVYRLVNRLEELFLRLVDKGELQGEQGA